MDQRGSDATITTTPTPSSSEIKQGHYERDERRCYESIRANLFLARVAGQEPSLALPLSFFTPDPTPPHTP